MPAIFSNSPGTLVAFFEKPGVPFRMEGWNGGGSMKAIITTAGLSAQSNVQFIHTLRDLIYVYVFGERAATLNVSGMIFGGDCNGSGNSGLESVFSYYNSYRISNSGRQVAVQFGTSSVGRFNAFLVGMPTAAITDAAMNMGQFSFTFQVFPR